MRKVLILVEGQTEEKFVKEVLNPHLNNYGKYLIPTLLRTKIVKSGPNFKGGITSYTQVRRDLMRLLGDTSALCITTMFDLYGLPSEFPGRQDAPAAPYDKVQHIENAFREDIDHPNFLVNLTLHEFEGLLFTKPAEIARALYDPDKEPELTKIKAAFKTPEEINDNPKTAPSKRLKDIFPMYNKPFYGMVISKRIGLQAIRAECPHFHQWVSRLENLQS
jgi:hypothetical protein